MKRTGKTLIAVALRPEAKPLINLLDLKQVTGGGGFSVYGNEDTLLVISGVGRCRMAAAVGQVFGAFGEEIQLAVTIGVAGSVTEGLAVGTPVLINKITEQASGHEYFPDMVAWSSLREASLTTVDRVVTSTESAQFGSDVVDMEGSAFFSTAAMWLSPHQIRCFKVVSDAVSDSKPSAVAVSGLIESAWPAFKSALATSRYLLTLQTDPLSDEELTICHNLCDHLRLTATQTVQLQESVKRYLLLQPDPLPDFSEIFDEPVQSKTDGKRLLSKIQADMLSIPEAP